MASPVDTSVKFMTSDMANAPTVTNTAGSVIAALDAFLVNGIDPRTATSLTVSGGIATLTFSGGTHAALPQSVIVVDGVTGAMTALNGEQKIRTASSTTLTFATAVSDGTASGTITFKLAPLGWTKAYSGTNLAAYKSSDMASTGGLLRVDDTGTSSVRVRMYESMTDINTGTSMAPPDAKVNGGLHWWKADSGNTGVARKYTFFGDSRVVYCAFAPYVLAVPTHVISGFGDFVSYKPSDSFASFLAGETIALTTSPTGTILLGGSGEHLQLMRAHHGLGGPTPAMRRPLGGGTTVASGNDNYLGAFPAAANNGLFLTQMIIGPSDIATVGPRGYFPGLLYCPQTATNGVFQRGAIIDGTGPFSGRKLYVVHQASNSIQVSGNDYAGFFDVTGPWR